MWASAPDSVGEDSEPSDRGVIDWLEGNFRQSLRLDNLAALVRMSSSTFHHHFLAMTVLSPLQINKQFRRKWTMFDRGKKTKDVSFKLTRMK